MHGATMKVQNALLRYIEYLMNTLGRSRGFELEEKTNVTTGENINLLKLFSNTTPRRRGGFE